MYSIAWLASIPECNETFSVAFNKAVLRTQYIYTLITKSQRLACKSAVKVKSTRIGFSKGISYKMLWFVVYRYNKCIL
jgi:hypothetical protein